MKPESNKEKLIAFLNDQLSKADFRARGYVFDDHNNKRPKHNLFARVNSYFDKFLSGSTAVRWLTLTGLRGAGKTTILFQIYSEKNSVDCYKLFLSVDHVVQLLNSDLNEILSVYEELLGVAFEKLDRPLLLFLDEVQCDHKWGIALKSLYDRSNKIFIFATGSAALLMNSNTDVARRTVYEKMFPLSFTEYLEIKHNKHEIKKTALDLSKIFFESNDGISVYKELKKKEAQINSSLLGVGQYEYERYLNFGTLPFMLTLDNEALVYDQINKMLERIINCDITTASNLSSEVMNKIPGLLYAVAGMDEINFSKFASDFELSRPKITEIFGLLQAAEVLTRVVPYGSNLSQARKPSKFYFATPSFRAMYYKSAGSIISAEQARGKILEDLVCMYLMRFLSTQPVKFLAYDGAQGGADFIVGFGDKKIVIEVGASEKNYRQVAKTAEKVRPNYSLVISDGGLDYSEEYNAVKMPLKMFLLV